MIKVENPEKPYYTCQSCDSNRDVLKIVVGYNELSTSSFRICDECFGLLRRKWEIERNIVNGRKEKDGE